MIDPARVQALNDAPIVSGEFVLCWMQASQRCEYNHALEYAIEQANAIKVPVIVGFGLTDDYPEANERHYAFMLEGLRDVEEGLKARGIRLVVQRGSPPDVAVALARDASMVVCDRGYLRLQKRWREDVADRAGKGAPGGPRRVVQVETDVVVPVEEASDKHEIAARTLRPKIHRLWEKYLRPVPRIAPIHSSLRLRISSGLDVADVDAALAKLKIDRSVRRSARFTGGAVAAHRVFAHFLEHKLAGYSQRRNEPSGQGTSTMSAYLHFGQVSPVELAVAVKRSKAPAADVDAYLEELIVRRELAVNFTFYNPNYDQYDGIPGWARKTLAAHAGDPRPHLYSRDQLESAQTHDPYWNAAQTEMTRTGFMHNYMRMYWGKKVLEWKATPQEAYADLLHLNNKHFLCGRDPNAYANVAWIFGLHDRPWSGRPVFGNVRYMNAAGLERKFDMDKYVDWVGGLVVSRA